MKDGRVPPPGFDSKRYERPNKDWVCGHACDGCPCRIGPSPTGDCRATTECSPRLAPKAGETKATWFCTVPAAWGGACTEGPRPDGSCCRPISRCRPIRSLRARRTLVVWAATAACVAAVLVGFSGASRERFINPRALSRHHSGAEFARLAAASGGGKGCVLCHADAHANFDDLSLNAIAASRASLRFGELKSTHPRDFSQMDRSCLACHSAKGFHQADVAQGTSCSLCHLEHRGSGPMAAVPAHACIDCHGDAKQMTRARILGAGMPAFAFEPSISASLVVHETRRPETGFTEVITGFAVDHPEFRVLREKSVDTNTLKFNHRLHLTGAGIPLVNGKALDCAYCHKPDASGAFMARISFEQSCRACHALDFDSHNPGMTLPHGDPAFVRAYLRILLSNTPTTRQDPSGFQGSARWMRLSAGRWPACGRSRVRAMTLSGGSS